MKRVARQHDEADTERLYLDLRRRIKERNARVCVVGLGYVGLPLALAFAERAELRVVGLDINERLVDRLHKGTSHLPHIDGERVKRQLKRNLHFASRFGGEMRTCDVILVTVPTPLTEHREPDLSFVLSTMKRIAKHLGRGHLVVLESTTYPGTTDGPVRGVLELSGLKAGEDFFLAYSPEREDPGNEQYATTEIPRIVGGTEDRSAILAAELYQTAFSSVLTTKDARSAEATKLTENIFRSVNIALVNELKVIYDAMGIDIWHVLEAAESKPFGFMRFNPGPGVGGHCIPLDPFYLTWKAREYGLTTKFVELAGEINMAMPRYVFDKLQTALNDRSRAVSESRVLLLGVAYKPNVADVRESPSFPLADLLVRAGSDVDYHDPLVPKLPKLRRWQQLRQRLGKSVPLTRERVSGYDAVIICTNHDDVNYELIARSARMVVDTCGQLQGAPGSYVVRA